MRGKIGGTPEKKLKIISPILSQHTYVGIVKNVQFPPLSRLAVKDGAADFNLWKFLNGH